MPLNRTSHTMLSALLATTTLSTVVFGVTPALAQPQEPDSASEAEQRLRELSRQAEVLTEDVKKAEEDHAAREREFAESTAAARRASVAAERARDEEERYRAQVDEFAAAAYRGARLNELATLLTSESPQSYLDRATAVDILSEDHNEAVHGLAAATRRAEKVQRRADEERARAGRAETEAARLEHDIVGRKKQMDAQIDQVNQQYNRLTSAEQESLSDEGAETDPLPGSGVAIGAVNAALSKQGSPYVWGAKGPNQFDCSGLVQWSYQQAGTSVSASTRSQVTEGTAVSENELKPGDVIFFYSSASHNGIYIGDGKVVHAPTEGQNVKVEEYNYIGDVHSIRRIAG